MRSLMPDLRRRQADAGRGVHGLDHVAQQLVDLSVDVGDVGGRLLENRLRELEDASKGHRAEVIGIVFLMHQGHRR